MKTAIIKKRAKMTPEENKHACMVRRRIEDIKDAKNIRLLIALI